MSEQERIDQLEARAARLEARLTEHEANVKRIENRLDQVESQHQQLMMMLGVMADSDKPTTLHGLLGSMAKVRLN